RGAQFDQGCTAPTTITVSFNGTLVAVPPASYTSDTITVTVPISATSGNVTVTTQTGTSNPVFIAVVRPQVMLPLLMKDFSAPTFNWLDVSDGARLPLGDDDVTSVTLPFPFRYFSATYNSVYVSSNGFISFTPLADSYPERSCIPNPAPPNNAVYAFWSDLVPTPTPALTGSDAPVWAKQVGNNFVIEWQQVPRYRSIDLETFEIILSSNDLISIQYLSVNSTNDVAVGAENADGSGGIETYCNHSNPPVVNVGTPPQNLQIVYYSLP
ncbi:MAG: hypothetical protein LC737_11600, partial [Chloroflexi bacterium]|nr:hypothetical protein [Chloroflexota bacterium]